MARLSIGVLLCLSCITVAADTVLYFKTSNSRTPDTIYIKDYKIRLSNKADPVVTLFDRSANSITFMHQIDKTYFEVTQQGLEEIIAAIKNMQQQMKRGLSPRKQAQLDKVFKKRGLSFNQSIATHSVDKVGTSVIKGIDCDVYVTNIHGRPEATHCVANGRYLGVNSVDFKTYLYLMRYLKQTAFALNLDPIMQSGFTGMPIISYDKNKKVMSKFLRVSGSNLDPALFMVPKNYQRVAHANLIQ